MGVFVTPAMSATNYQGWMTVIGVWLIATMVSVGLYALTESVESELFTAAIAFVTFINVVFAVVDLARGAASEDSAGEG